MNYVVFEVAGKQYKAEKGQTVLVEKLENASGSISIDKILLRVEDGKVELGNPYVKDAKVTATILSEVKSDKVRVGRFTAKSRHRRVYGHRHLYAQIRVDDITTK